MLLIHELWTLEFIVHEKETAKWSILDSFASTVNSQSSVTLKLRHQNKTKIQAGLNFKYYEEFMVKPCLSCKEKKICEILNYMGLLD